MQINRNLAAWMLSGALLTPTYALSDVWVFEPSAALDLRVDDNYTIDTEVADPVNATRLVGSIGLSRESQNTAFKGLIRVDGLLQQSDTESNELSSNQIFFLDSKTSSERSTLGITLNFKQDTPSRDISADITDLSVTAADTGASVSQDQNVARQRLVVTPSWQYKLSRRTTFDTSFSYTTVEHELPTVEEALDSLFDTQEEIDRFLTDDTQVFFVEDELDDFKEAALTLGLRHSWSPLVDLTASISYKDFQSQVELDNQIVQLAPPGEDPLSIPDPNQRRLLRSPKRTSKSTTTTINLGFERSLSPTLRIGFSVGAYNNTVDDTDLIRSTDLIRNEELAADARARATESENGWLGGITLSKNTGLTRYTARFGVDVLPSDIGSQVESLDLVGDMVREISPRMDFAMRARAYEPDAINATGADEFSRRFISFEPKLIWQYSRAWTVAGSYRYRRQKSRADVNSGESNAFLISLKYTPPSAIRDAERGGQ